MVSFRDIFICLGCGGDYTHFEQVEIFDRAEDAEEGLHVKVASGLVSTDRSMKDNPSGRRDGVRIEFYCENCCAISVLTLAQHKGQTIIECSLLP